MDYFVDLDTFYDLKAGRIDRCANKSKQSTNVTPIAALRANITSNARACSIRDAIRISIVLAFSCGRAKTIRIRYVWTRIFLKTE